MCGREPEASVESGILTKEAERRKGPKCRESQPGHRFSLSFSAACAPS
jgi:hypothetical protein